MIEAVRNAFRLPDLRRKLLITLGILAWPAASSPTTPESEHVHHAARAVSPVRAARHGLLQPLVLSRKDHGAAGTLAALRASRESGPLDRQFLLPAIAVTAISVAMLAPAALAGRSCGLGVLRDALGPVIGIVHSGHQLTNDRYSYLPGLGFALLIGAAAGAAAQAGMAGTLRPALAKAVAALGIVWFCGLAYLSARQVQIGTTQRRSGGTGWSPIRTARSVTVTGSSARMAVSSNWPRPSSSAFSALRPDQVKVHQHLGYTYAMLEDFRRALGHVEIFFARYPNDVEGSTISAPRCSTAGGPTRRSNICSARSRSSPGTSSRTSTSASRMPTSVARPKRSPRFARRSRFSTIRLRPGSGSPGEVRVGTASGRAHGLGNPRTDRQEARKPHRARVPSNLVNVATLQAVADAWPAGMLAAVVLFGLAIGSFLNVVIVRVPEVEASGIPAPPVPAAVPSWRGMTTFRCCRFCGSAAAAEVRHTNSRRYPIVEGVTAVALASAYLVFGPTGDLIVAAVLLATLVVVTAIDLQHQLIPDVITLPGILVGLTRTSRRDTFPGAIPSSESRWGAASSWRSSW